MISPGSVRGRPASESPLQHRPYSSSTSASPSRMAVFKAGGGLGDDRWKAIRPVMPATGQNFHAGWLDVDGQSIAIPLNLENPVSALWWL